MFPAADPQPIWFLRKPTVRGAPMTVAVS